MKRRFICIFAGLFSAIFTFNAYAASIDVKDSVTNLISVSGTASEHSHAVSLVVLNPGYTEEDISSAPYADQSDVIQYFSVTYPQNGTFNFNVAMRDTTAAGIGGGAYRFIITTNGERVHDDDYLFYFNDVKLGIIGTINSQSTISSSTLADAYYKFGLSQIPLYSGDLDALVSALTALRNNIASKTFELDVNKFDLTLKQAALLSAYNTSNTSLLTEQGYLIYPDLLGIESLQLWSDYKTKLSESAVSALNAKLIAGTYTSIEQICTELKELVAYYGLISHKDGGFAHIDTFLTNYSDVYSKYDFQTYLLTAENKNAVYNQLLDTSANNITELAAEFNSIVSDYGESGGKGGSSGSGGGGFSGGGSMGGTVSTDSYITPEIGFDDLSSAEWARESVMALAEKGIISGKAKRIFAPNDYVTRAEFMKMLISALEITGTQTECDFEDVGGHWGKQYIITAAETGIAKGITETTFEPDGIIKREMGAVFLNRALEYKNITLAKDEALFADDSTISEYAKDSVYRLKLAGMISGVGDNIFDSQGYVTRAQAAKMIYEVMIYSEGEANR